MLQAESNENFGLPPFFDSDNTTFQACVSSSGVDIIEFRKLIPPNNEELSESLLCFLKCMGEKSGFLNADGSLNLEKIKAKSELGYINDTVKVKLDRCLKNVKKIETCMDIMQFRCFCCDE